MLSSRRSVLMQAATSLAVSSAAPGALAAAGRAAPLSPDAQREVQEVLQRATLGHVALMRGDLAGYREALQISDDFTLMSPFGGQPTHVSSLTEERWQGVAAFFKGGRDSTVELLQAYHSPEMITLMLREHTHVAVGALPAQHWSLRVTLVFTKQAGTWKLAHRHADPLVAGISVEQAARLAGEPLTA